MNVKNDPTNYCAPARPGGNASMVSPARLKAIVRLVSLAAFFLTSAIYAQDSYALGRIAFSKKKYDEARKHFENSLERNPSNGNPCFYLGYMLDYQNHRDLAVQQYRRGVDLNMDTDLRDKSYWKIILYYKYVQDWDNVAVYGERFLKYRDVADIRKLVEEAKDKRDPDKEKIRQLLTSAEKKKEAGDITGAKSDYKSVLAIRWDETTAWNLASIEMQQREYPEAQGLYTKLIEQKPGWEYYYKRGVSKYYLRDYEPSLRDFDEARRLNKKPDANSKYYVTVAEGLSNFELGNHAIAKEKLIQAATIKKSPVVDSALVRVYFATGDRKSATSTLEKIGAAEKERALSESLLYYAPERPVTERTKGKVAYRQYLNAVKLDAYPPESTFAFLYFLGKQASAMGDSELCLNSMEMVEKAPEPVGKILDRILPAQKDADADRMFHFYYGKALLDTGRTDSAIQRLTRSQEIPVVKYYLGAAYARKGNEQKAMDFLAAGAERNPEYWVYAGSNQDYSALAKSNPDFSYFVTSKGKRPEPKQEKVEGKFSEVNKNEKQTDRLP